MPKDADNKRKRKVFEDVSTVQVVATALAAVTSMLLSSYIGIAGSIIGVAVASIVSTLAASLYKKFLAESADKIKHLPVLGTKGETLADLLEGKHGTDTAERDDQAEGEADDGKEPNGSDAESTVSEHPAAPNQHDEEGRAPEDGIDAQLAHQRRMVHGLIAVCVISALLAVVASAAVVYLATTGEGLGQKTPPITWIAQDSGRSSETTAPAANASASTPPEPQAAPANEASNTASEPPDTEQGASNATSNGGPTNTDASSSSAPDEPAPDAPANTEQS